MPKPSSPRRAVGKELEAGKTYYWCACGGRQAAVLRRLAQGRRHGPQPSPPRRRNRLALRLQAVKECALLRRLAQEPVSAGRRNAKAGGDPAGLSRFLRRPHDESRRRARARRGRHRLFLSRAFRRGARARRLRRRPARRAPYDRRRLGRAGGRRRQSEIGRRDPRLAAAPRALARLHRLGGALDAQPPRHGVAHGDQGA